MPDIPPKAFTVSYDGRAAALVTPVQIGQAFDHSKLPGPPGGVEEFQAVWDTGATNSVITERVVDKCDLKPIGMAEVNTVGGSQKAPVYLVSVRLPMGVGISDVRVTLGQIAGNSEVLIGMDVIGNGDFAVTCYEGQTMFSFRFPSIQKIDFVNPIPIARTLPSVGRNEPCPCGSGRKYKHCHGKNR